MKILIVATLFLALGPGGVPQDRTSKVLPGPKVAVYAIEASMAFAPGSVAIKGKNLGLVREVRVNGTTVPVVANNGGRILIEPGAQDPGFGVLELVTARHVLREAVEFMPSLRARWRYGRVRTRFNPGGSGWYILNYSYKQRRTPVAHPNVYYLEMLDMTSSHSGWLAGGTFSFGDVLFSPWMRVPPIVSAVGKLGTLTPANLQAICMIDGDMCFSNMEPVQPTM